MSHKGTSTFIMQRASAVILIPIAIWFLWSLMAHAGEDLAGAEAWLKKPLNFGLFGTFVTIGALHGRIGVSEVIDDYIHGGMRGLFSALNWVVAIAVIAVTWWSLLSL
ncbi:MAG: succinate dehydrogenase, hydrophobic membrane anchor protein [Pseudomonadota bacterium]